MTIEEIIDTLNDIETDAIYSLLNSEKQAIEEAIEILEKVESGKTIELPCKVGDTVYKCVFYKDGKGHCISEKVVGFHRGDFPKLRGCKRKEYLIIFHEVTNSLSHLDIEQIGKTVFLTRDEAEKALKEWETK